MRGPRVFARERGPGTIRALEREALSDPAGRPSSIAGTTITPSPRGSALIDQHSWINNSHEAADDHDLAATDEEYERATDGRLMDPAQHPAQSEADNGREEPDRQKTKGRVPRETRESRP